MERDNPKAWHTVFLVISRVCSNCSLPRTLRGTAPTFCAWQLHCLECDLFHGVLIRQLAFQDRLDVKKVRSLIGRFRSNYSFFSLSSFSLLIYLFFIYSFLLFFSFFASYFQKMRQNEEIKKKMYS